MSVRFGLMSIDRQAELQGKAERQKGRVGKKKGRKADIRNKKGRKAEREEENKAERGGLISSDVLVHTHPLRCQRRCRINGGHETDTG
jgi:hypothetical protein